MENTVSSNTGAPIPQSNSAPAMAAVVDDVHAKAADFIAYWEGFRANAYWDVNHWRVGFGSDTEGPGQSNVTKATTTTRVRALQNLTLRVPQYEAIAMRELGVLWDKLGDATKVAVIDLCYNYGTIEGDILKAFLTNGSLVADAIRKHDGDNSGVNHDRRGAEAGLVIFDGGQVQ